MARCSSLLFSLPFQYVGFATWAAAHSLPSILLPPPALLWAFRVHLQPPLFHFNTLTARSPSLLSGFWLCQPLVAFGCRLGFWELSPSWLLGLPSLFSSGRVVGSLLPPLPLRPACLVWALLFPPLRLFRPPLDWLFCRLRSPRLAFFLSGQSTPHPRATLLLSSCIPHPPYLVRHHPPLLRPLFLLLSRSSTLFAPASSTTVFHATCIRCDPLSIFACAYSCLSASLSPPPAEAGPATRCRVLGSCAISLLNTPGALVPDLIAGCFTYFVLSFLLNARGSVA